MRLLLLLLLACWLGSALSVKPKGWECQNWAKRDDRSYSYSNDNWLFWLRSRYPCPLTPSDALQALNNRSWLGDVCCSQKSSRVPSQCGGNCAHHPGAEFCILSKPVRVDHSVQGRQQCCYSNSQLLTDPRRGAGTADRGTRSWSHYEKDVKPFKLCCGTGEDFNLESSVCNVYLQRRPPNPGISKKIRCMDWSRRDDELSQKSGDWLFRLRDVYPCPRTPYAALQAVNDSSWLDDKCCSHNPLLVFRPFCGRNCAYHPGAEFCIRSKPVRLEDGSQGRQQCCYSNSQLLTDASRGAGTADRGAPLLKHHEHDVKPFKECCVTGKDLNLESSLCSKYLTRRPPNVGPTNKSRCMDWARKDDEYSRQAGNWLLRLRSTYPCPLSRDTALRYLRSSYWMHDKCCSLRFWYYSSRTCGECAYHPGAEFCILSKPVRLEDGTHGRQQCCYSKTRLLTNGREGAGTADRGAGLSTHDIHDIMPMRYCCGSGKLFNLRGQLCQHYLRRRPPNYF